MDLIKIGFDDNLGLPNDFANTIGCELVAFHELELMIQAFNEEKLAAIFTPSGSLCYIPQYTIIAQALFGNEKKLTLQSNFVTTKPISISDIPHLLLGRVNQYCTTSFWAPQIYLMNYLPRKTILHFKNTAGFPDMLHQTAEAKVDASMTWDIIMKQHPADADKVKMLFFKNDLPTPVIICKNDLDSILKSRLQNFHTSQRNVFFTGFQLPHLEAINIFLQEIQKVRDYFRVL